ncbi:Nucleoside-triphosphatase THEP1 [bacterium HR17]|uniref:Nucleoside-triphosphatase THEP1 n=1 Tax=Candidatus Fervidibacter japonicus TaxID=2035412 RepID=A0A2H5XEB5_9BACT|nr:Nucleoside-triphosphatase THEP1 [bacterium HR17]
MARKNWLLTGTPGIGKTTVVQRTLNLLPPAWRVIGFFTEEVREHGERVGFQIVTLDGQRAWLARKGMASPYQIGRYGVDTDAIARVIVPTLQRALQEADLIVVDEIAKMELCHPAFAEVVWACLDSPRPVLGAIQQSRLSFLDKVRQRSDVEIVTVTRENRDALPHQLAATLTALVGRG